MENKLRNGWVPDPRLHAIMSFIKSGVRIVGYGFLPFDIWVAAGLLIAAEGIGIVEEMV
tara:strand:- start:352 stop:528 length:177 start_codon:yes stop_codon:yes gene_type:complete